MIKVLSEFIKAQDMTQIQNKSAYIKVIIDRLQGKELAVSAGQDNAPGCPAR